MRDTQSSSIRARGLTKKFGDFTAVNGVTFDVYEGEIFGFLGPNGSGKTTTIRMMLGLLPPSAGHVEVLNVPVSDGVAAIRQRVGYMAQRFSLYNDLTVRQNLLFYGRAYGLKGRELESAIAKAVELSGLVGREEARTGELAGGWRQRLALSAAILHRPELIFLDEPTAGVDPVSRREFWELLYQLVEEGVTVFVTTHYMDEAEHCHRLAFIQRGVLIASGPPGQIKREQMRGRVVRVATPNPAEALSALQNAAQVGAVPLKHLELFGTSLHVLLGEGGMTDEALVRLLRQVGIEEATVQQVEPSLEDVFIESMREPADGAAVVGSRGLDGGTA